MSGWNCPAVAWNPPPDLPAQCQAGRLPTVAAHLPGGPCGSATAEKRGGVDGIFMGFFLDFHGISMGLWYFYGIYEAFMGL